jgi:hypothetical protein
MPESNQILWDKRAMGGFGVTAKYREYQSCWLIPTEERERKY